MAYTPIEEDTIIKNKQTGEEYPMNAGDAYDPSIYNIVGSDSIQPTGDIEYNEPEDTPPFDITKLDFETTDPEKEAQSLTEELQQLNLGLVGEGAFTAQQEEIQGIESLKKAKQDLDNQLKVLQAEALAIPQQAQLEAEGRGITAAGLRPITTARLRENAIKALTVSALSQAANGNLATALDLVDRAVAQKYDPIREEINAKMKNLDLILRSPEYTQAEKKRAAEQQAILANQEAEVAAQEAEQKAIWDLSIDAVSAGADAVTLQKIRDAETKEEALQIMTEAGLFVEPEVAVKRDTKITERDGRNVLIDMQTGETIQDLGVADVPDGEKGFSFSSNDRGRLSVVGISNDKINALQQGIRDYGWEAVKAAEESMGATPEQLESIEQILKGITPTQAGKEEEITPLSTANINKIASGIFLKTQTDFEDIISVGTITTKDKAGKSIKVVLSDKQKEDILAVINKIPEDVKKLISEDPEKYIIKSDGIYDKGNRFNPFDKRVFKF